MNMLIWVMCASRIIIQLLGFKRHWWSYTIQSIHTIGSDDRCVIFQQIKTYHKIVCIFPGIRTALLRHLVTHFQWIQLCITPALYKHVVTQRDVVNVCSISNWCIWLLRWNGIVLQIHQHDAKMCYLYRGAIQIPNMYIHRRFVQVGNPPNGIAGKNPTSTHDSANLY